MEAAAADKKAEDAGVRIERAGRHFAMLHASRHLLGRLLERRPALAAKLLAQAAEHGLREMESADRLRFTHQGVTYVTNTRCLKLIDAYSII
jgi:hypothetical protein